MIKASDSRQVTDSTPIRSTYMAYNIAAWQVVHTHVPLTKQQNFMPAKGRGLLCSWKGKLTLGHWDGQKVGLMWECLTRTRQRRLLYNTYQTDMTRCMGQEGCLSHSAALCLPILPPPLCPIRTRGMWVVFEDDLVWKHGNNRTQYVDSSVSTAVICLSPNSGPAINNSVHIQSK